MKILAIRHAKPLVDPGVCYGQLDMPAEESSTQEAARQIAGFLPADIAIYVSPLQRCVALAEEIRRLRPEMKFSMDERLKEMNFGEWEGRKWSDISPEKMDSWTTSFAHFKTAGGESTFEFVSRVKDALSECLLEHPLESVVWITHAGVIRSLELIRQSGNDESSVGFATQSADRWPKTNLPFGGVTEMNFTASKPAWSV